MIGDDARTRIAFVFGLCSQHPQIIALAQEQIDYEHAITEIVALTNLPSDEVRRRFRAHHETQPSGWRACAAYLDNRIARGDPVDS